MLYAKTPVTANNTKTKNKHTFFIKNSFYLLKNLYTGTSPYFWGKISDKNRKN